MSNWENSLFSYVEGRLIPLERKGVCYYFRNNSFAGRIMRYDGSQGFIKNNKKGTPDVVACFPRQQWHVKDDFGKIIAEANIFGEFVGFELKTLVGKQSPAQKEAQKAIESAGGKYYLIRTPEEFECALKELL